MMPTISVLFGVLSYLVLDILLEVGFKGRSMINLSWELWHEDEGDHHGSGTEQYLLQGLPNKL